MATTASEQKLLIGGEWVETGDWVDVCSPYSGDLIGRVAKAGAAEARRAIDAAEAAMRDPLPAHKRAEILVKVAGYLGRRHEEVAQTISAEAGKPLKAARVEASRAMSTFTMAAVEARKLAGLPVPPRPLDVNPAARLIGVAALSAALWRWRLSNGRLPRSRGSSGQALVQSPQLFVAVVLDDDSSSSS